MITHKGGTVVEKGLYWNPLDGQRLDMRKRGILPGDESKNYLKISPVGLLVVAPLFGMTYVMFLPLFGIGVFLISCLVRTIGSLAAVASPGVRVCRRIAGRSVFFGWNPSRAYFTSVRKKKRRGVRTPAT